MSEATNLEQPPAIESPPAAAAPARDLTPDPRQSLHRLACELMRCQNRKLLVELMQLRRALH